MIQENIRELVQYGLLTGLVEKEDEIYTTNRLLELFGEEDYPFGFGEEIGRSREEAVKRLPELLTEMMDYAVKKGIMPEDGVVYRDLFDTKIMGCLVGRPSEIIRKFWAEYEKSPEAATEFFYRFSQDTDYIRRYRVCKDEKGPEGDCGSEACKAERLSEMPALRGKRGLCGTDQPSGAPEPSDHPDHDQRQPVGDAVFALCLL